MTLGIGPHSSFSVFLYICLLLWSIKIINVKKSRGGDSKVQSVHRDANFTRGRPLSWPYSSGHRIVAANLDQDASRQ